MSLSCHLSVTKHGFKSLWSLSYIDLTTFSFCEKQMTTSTFVLKFSPLTPTWVKSTHQHILTDWPGTEGRPGAAPVEHGRAQGEEGWVQGSHWASSHSPLQSPEHVGSTHRLKEDTVWQWSRWAELKHYCRPCWFKILKFHSRSNIS